MNWRRGFGRIGIALAIPLATLSVVTVMEVGRSEATYLARNWMPLTAILAGVLVIGWILSGFRQPR